MPCMWRRRILFRCIKTFSFYKWIILSVWFCQMTHTRTPHSIIWANLRGKDERWILFAKMRRCWLFPAICHMVWWKHSSCSGEPLFSGQRTILQGLMNHCSIVHEPCVRFWPSKHWLLKDCISLVIRKIWDSLSIFLWTDSFLEESLDSKCFQENITILWMNVVSTQMRHEYGWKNDGRERKGKDVGASILSKRVFVNSVFHLRGLTLMCVLVRNSWWGCTENRLLLFPLPNSKTSCQV